MHIHSVKMNSPMHYYSVLDTHPLISLIEDVTYRVGRLVISLGSKEGKGANEMSYDFK